MARTMDAIRDMYDLLEPERGAELRRRNKERLAELEAQGAERRARLARVADQAPLAGERDQAA
jgi:hypothetical protein